MVVWANYLQNVADFMGTTTEQAGVISSLIWVVFAILMVLVASKKGKGLIVSIPVTAFFSILLFTFIGWFPTWTGSVIALVLVIFIGFVFGKMSGVT